jgi:lysophospholipase L1-like esterase
LGDLNVSVLRRCPGSSYLLTALAGLALACVPTSHADPLPSRPEQPAPVQPLSLASEKPTAAPVEPAPPPYVPREQDLVTVHQPIEFPEHLTHFLDSLTAVDDGKQQVVRVVHVGASAIGADDLPAILRERFQTRFGDGGAGLVLMARYMDNYLHRWVKLEASGWDHCYIAYKCLADGHYGLGGAAFWATSGATTTISTRKHELGDEAANIELWYLARPGGGRVELMIDEGDPIVVDTRAEAMEDRYHSVRVEPGAHSVRVRALGHGSSRLYGVMLETDTGVVWDQFSQLGVFTSRVLEWDADHLAGQIQHRDPDLIVFAYGGNDLRRVANGKLDQAGYVEEFRAAVEHMRRGKPQASCLITAINDRGKSLTYDIDAEHVEVIVEAQREVARQTGCAFFDTYAAMGGPGSFADWRKRKLAAGDDKHLNHAGRELLGGWMYDAVIAAYVERRKSVSGAHK